MKPIEVEYSTNDSSVQPSDKNKEFKKGKCVPSDNKELNERLCEIARKAFVSMNGKSYGRVDFRVNENNEIYLIDLNFSPRIFITNQPTRSDFILENDLTFKKEKFIQVLIELAFKEHRKRQSPYYVAFREEVYGQRCLIANRDITKGKLKFLIEQLCLKCLQLKSLILNPYNIRRIGVKVRRRTSKCDISRMGAQKIQGPR